MAPVPPAPGFGASPAAPPGGTPFGGSPKGGSGPQPAVNSPNCPQCGSPNPRNTRFCITCGFDTSSAAAPAPIASPAASPPLSGQQPVAPAPSFGAPVGAPVAPPPTPFREPAPATAAQPSRARLVLIRPDGTEGGVFPLNEGSTLVGREAGALFASDTYLSPRHATFIVHGSTVTVRDERSLNGVYVRIAAQQPVELQDGDVFRIGQEILKYEAFRPVQPEPDGTERQGAQIEGLVGRIALVVGRDTIGNAFPIPVTGLFLGRERGDILFPDDGYVSGLHCQLAVEGGRLMLTDVGSSNGTYLRIRGERQVRANDLLLMGQQLFRLSL